MSKLRPYQKRDYDNIIEELKKVNSILYQAPTGSGKSVVMEEFILNHKTEKILILAHKRELVFQMKKRLETNGLKVGIIIASIEENLDSNIIIASIRTITSDNRIKAILDKGFNQIIIDEAHHIRTTSYENVIDQLTEQNKNIKLLGVTATPYRKDKKLLSKYFDILICSDDIQTLQNNGYLSKYRVYYTPAKDIDEEVESTGNDYQLQSLSDYMRKPEMIQFAVDSYIKHGNNKQMIIFCVDKKHAKLVKEAYERNSFTNIAHIDSDTKLPDRAKILVDFANNDLQLITCIETLTEGVDLPETKVIQLLRPTQSIILYLQMVGRGSRLKQDGDECIILDNAGCTIEHKLPNSPRHWTLNSEINPSNPNKKNRIVGKRKDGTFTEDEDEMSFLELIEMTPEEYVTNISGGIEKSEQLNKETDNKCKELLKSIGEFCCNKIKDKDYSINFKYYDNDYYSKDKIYIQNKTGGYGIEIEYKKSIQYLTIKSDNIWGGSRDKQDAIQKCKSNIVLGKLSEELMKDKNMKHIIDIFDEVEDLQSNKIDINDLRVKAKSFHKEQLKIKLANYVITNNEITLPREIWMSNYFKNSGYGKCNLIKFKKNKLMVNNDVTFKIEERRDFEKVITQEKLIEILEDTKWE